MAGHYLSWRRRHNGESAKIAFDVIRDYNRIAAKYMDESRIADGSWWSPEEEDGGYGPVTADRLRHAVKIVEKPWFGRVWVFQEVGLSNNALLAYGGSTINFTEVMDLVEAWGQAGNDFPGISFNSGWISSFFSNIWATYSASIDQSWYRSSFILTTSARHAMRRKMPEFLDVLFKARQMQKATDPRDFVYAFLGHPLARSEDGELLVEADYTITISELRLRLFSRLTQRSLRFLGLTWHKTSADLLEGPSWCPHLDTRRSHAINDRYDASRGEYLLIPAGEHRARVNSSCLEASVYIVDTVLFCGEIAGGHEDASYGPTERMLSAQSSLAEEYWAVLEATESRNGLAYPDKALAFASTLLHSRDGEDHASTAKSFGDFCRDHCPVIQTYLDKHEWLDQWASAKAFIPFIPRSGSSINGERFFTTTKGYCGTSTPLVEPGDLICIIPSVQTPLVIRPVEGKDKTFRMIGSSYVYGMMYGEVFQTSEPGRSPPEVLVARFV
ncbi:hypothetical protein FJTKL_13159 [Diaporthe vaccinii]|uniref:Heterokaryon incompatibility domain-containing protein n=1 Tax=Diaporthe vaccinii TaxID=105482 RepID=A0ABR4EBM1_9PEZI